ncbi:glycerophosphoryl diester phosphodiesterase [Candidatus Symbiothrix dinenymphae]|nr:glycerophosphoryl diester phosphodiesterase [Candidatus Symbiothrix dinenymphae]
MNTKKVFLSILLLMSSAIGSCAFGNDGVNTQIIAHRGFWDKLGSAQNSVSSLRNAIAVGAYGSELDVHLTRDGYVVLSHDDKYQGVNIHGATYAELSALRLVNGEPLPSLQQYIEVVKTQNRTKLIVEIKPHHSPEADVRVANAVVNVINESGIADLVDYISFSADICKELIRLNPQHRVGYLAGNKSPQELKAEGFWGLNYSAGTLRDHPTWLKEAKELGLTTMVWTVNSLEEMQYFLQQGVDYITTDNPELLKGLLN